MTIDVDLVPAALRDREQWVCWRREERDGAETKVPVTPGTDEFASTTDSETWREFGSAVEALEMGDVDGIGFVFTSDDPLVGVDLDDCRDPETGEVTDVARDIVERLDSYTEISPSGTGFHVLVTGELPTGRNRRGHVELYETARFFTVTGEHVDVTPSRVAHRPDALEAIHREYVQDESECDSDSREDESVSRRTDVDLSDEQLLSKARNATNGRKFDRLWNGDTAGYESQSEADMALCCLLAFWTGGDRVQMDRLFRQSGLDRAKWDEVHYADGSTYGDRTIKRAIAHTTEFYDPDRAEVAESVSDDDVSDRAYLIEKNRLLSTRVDELEADLERKTERIETLEARLVDIQAERTVQPSDEEPGVDERPSIWGRLFGFRSE